MFLKNNRRIEAPISVTCLALLIFCLVERAVRLTVSLAVKLAGLRAGRPAKPTGRLIFTALSKAPTATGRPRQPSPDPRHCKPGCWTYSASTPDNPADPSSAGQGPTHPRPSMRGTPG